MQPNNQRQHGFWKIIYTKDFLNFVIWGFFGTAIVAGLISQEIHKANMRDEIDDIKGMMNKESKQNEGINHGNETCLICNSTYEW